MPFSAFFLRRYHMQFQFWAHFVSEKHNAGTDLWSKLGEVEWARTQSRDREKIHTAGAAERSHRPQHKPRLTAHAFRMTLVVQGNKLPQIIFCGLEKSRDRKNLLLIWLKSTIWNLHLRLKYFFALVNKISPRKKSPLKVKLLSFFLCRGVRQIY